MVKRTFVAVSACALLFFFSTRPADAAEYVVSSDAELRNALLLVTTGDTIRFATNITLTSDLPSIGVGVTIDGGGFALSGNDQYRGLIIQSSALRSTIDVSIQNLTIQNTVARGGDGGSGAAGGGGGAGAGGALLILDGAHVTVSNVALNSNSAIGGDGGSVVAGAVSGGGGGGLLGDGGSTTGDSAGGAGGTGGGGAGATGPSAIGSSGGTFGGGGGTVGPLGPSGPTFGANGGYGGGGGGSVGGISGGFGGAFAGAGSATGGGGGGAGLGGAIFIQGGGLASLTVAGAFTVNGSSVTGGLGGDSGASAGLSAGAAIMLRGAGLTLAPGANQTVTINGAIADSASFDESSGSVHVNGPGTVILNGTNTYTGSTTVSTGTLQITSDANLGATFADLELDNDAKLVINGSFTTDRFLGLDQWTGSIVIPTGQSVTWNGVVEEFNSSGFKLTGGGRLTLTNTGNFWSNATEITGNSTIAIDNDTQLGASDLILGDATTGGTLNITTDGSFSSDRNVIINAGGGSFDVNAGADAELFGAISGDGALTKAGLGNLTLSGDNTYKGATIVSAGTLTAGSFTAFGASTDLTIASGATVDLNRYDASFNTINGSGNLVLTSDCDGCTGLVVGSANGSSTFAGPISGAGYLDKIGTGTLTLSGTNTFSGGLFIDEGTVSVGADRNLGATGDVWIGFGAGLTLTGSDTYSHGLRLGSFFSESGTTTTTLTVTPGTRAVWTGVIGGFDDRPIFCISCDFLLSLPPVFTPSGFELNVNGGGIVEFTNPNNWFGGLHVTGNSEVIVPFDEALGGIFASVYLGDDTTRGTLGIEGSGFSSTRTIGLGAAGGVIETIGSTDATWAGAIGGVGGLTKDGTGTLLLTGANQYQGATVVASGKLVAGSDKAFGNSTALTVNGSATADFNHYSQNFYTLAGTGTIAFAGGETLTVGADNSSSAFAGAITGNGDLIKAGTGSLTLSGQSSYSGQTTVGGGTLIAGSDGAFGNSRVFDVKNGATLDLNGFTATMFKLNGSGTVALSKGANLNIGGDNSSSSFGGALTGSGGITKTGSGTFTLAGNNSYTGLTAVNGGTLLADGTNALGLSRSLSIGSNGTLNMNADHSFFTVDSAGTLALNGGARITIGSDNSNSVVGGTVIGNGAVIKTGTGTLALTGSNSFSGGLLVNNGTVAVSSDASLGALGNLVSLGSTGSIGTLAISGSGFNSGRAIVLGGLGGVIDTAAGTNAQFAGGIGGSGGLTKAGAGTLTLAGGSSFSGALAVTGGTLRAGAANVFSSGLLSLSAGTLADLNGFNQSVGSLAGTGALQLTNGAELAIGGDGSNSNFGGAISGTGSIVKNGNGLLALTGANTYRGLTRVNRGTLSGNSSSLPGDILNNGTVIFDQSGDGTFAGGINGTGLVVKNGAGTLTFGGVNTYSGGTLIAAGGLVGNTSNLQGLIVNDAALTFNQATNGAFNGLISGTGTVTKLGAGNVTFNSSHAFTGLLTVGQGQLTLNNVSLPGSVNVGTQATLLGTGTIGGNLTLGGQLILPGITQSTATAAGVSGFNTFRSAAIVPFATRDLPSMVINGDLIAAQGSKMTFTVGSSGAAPILVNGRANVAGTHLDVTIDDPNPSRTATYTAIKSLNGLSAAGADATTTSTSILPVLTQGQNSLLVTILSLRVPTSEVATTPNGIAAGRGVDAVKQCSTGELCDVVKEVLAITGPEFDTALNSLAGEIHASSKKLLVNDSRGMTNMVRDQLSAAEHDAEDDDTSRAPGGIVPWVQFTGEHSTFSGGPFSGGTANVGGGGGGLNFRPKPRLLTGGGAGFSFGSLSLSDISGTSALKAPRAFGYTGVKLGAYHLHVGSSVAKNNTSTKRGISLHARIPDENGNQVPLSNGIERQADADTSGYTQDAWTELQHTRKYERWLMDNKGGVRFTRYVRRAFSEEGAGAISLEAIEDVLKSREAHYDFNLWKKKGTWKPRIVLNYLHEFADAQTSADVNFQRRPDSQFEVSGFALPRDIYHGLFGLTYRTLSGLEYTLEYETTQASNESHHAVHMRMRFR